MNLLHACDGAPILKWLRTAGLVAYAAGAWLLAANVPHAIARFPAARAFQASPDCRAGLLLQPVVPQRGDGLCTTEVVHFNERYVDGEGGGRSVLLVQSAGGETLRFPLSQGKRSWEFAGGLVPGAALRLQRLAPQGGTAGAIRLSDGREVIPVGATPVVRFAFDAGRAILGLLLVMFGRQLRRTRR